MTSGIYPFSQIIEDVITETGITNIRNRIPELINLVARAEREINPYASLLIKKKMLYKVGNGNFDGKNIKKPKDFVQIDKVGCCDDGLCEGAYRETVSHIIICDKKVRSEIKFTYWALQHDGNGYPLITYNHADAVVAYIVWKTYAPNLYMGEGNLNTHIYYERNFEDRCCEARGEDLFPSEQQSLRIAKINQYSLLNLKIQTIKDICLSCDNCLETIEEPEIETPEEMKIYYWQLNTIQERLDDVLPLVNAAYLEDKPNQVFSVFEQGYTVANASIAALAIAIHETEFFYYRIYDVLNNDVTDEFQANYIAEEKIMLFVSVNHYSHSNILFKIVKL